MIEDLRKPQSRKGRPTAERAVLQRKALIDLALETFLKQGFERTTMEDLAQKADISKATIYRQYGSKSGLLIGIMQEVTLRLAATLRAVPLGACRPPEAVLEDFGAIIRDFHWSLEVFSLWSAVGEAKENLDLLLASLAHQQKASLEPLADYLRDLQTRGRIRELDMEEAAVLFSRMVGGGMFAKFRDKTAVGSMLSPLSMAVEIFLGGISVAR